MDSIWYKRMRDWEIHQDQQSKSDFGNTKGGWRRAIGLGGAITGFGF